MKNPNARTQFFHYFVTLCIAGSLSFASYGCSKQTASQATNTQAPEAETPQQIVAEQHNLTVYKSPTCGCCQKWIDQVGEQGFKVSVINKNDLSQTKLDLGIQKEHQSCHTAVSTNKYVFEGHIPVKYVQQFLANPPSDAIGLSVPGMPVGSPGMEYQNQFQPYQVLQLNKDGSTVVYANIQSAEQQF